MFLIFSICNLKKVQKLHFDNSVQNVKSGCTAVSALIRDNTIFLSWLGDSQAVLVKGGVPIKITSPHKPDREVCKVWFYKRVF